MTPYSVIKGFETNTCAGETFEDLWTACLKKESFIDERGLGEVKSSSYKDKGNPVAPVVSCIEKALEKSSWEGDRAEIGVILATTTGHTAAWEGSLMDYLSNEHKNTVEFVDCFSKEPLGRLLQDIKNKIGTQGPSTVISTACSASTHALGIAQTWIKLAKVKRCIVVSTELLCLLTTKGFESFNLLSKKPCAPFDKERDGINLSEAFGCICIEASDTIANNDIHIAGFGASTDTYQMTTPDPEGSGTTTSIKMAIANANVEPEKVKLIHCHGTASHYNDLAEAKAVKSIWPNINYRPLVTSTKGVHGHALGASGLIETCISIQAMKDNTCPPTTGFENADPELDVTPVKESTHTNLDCVVKNTLGFGGANATILLKRGG